MSAQTPPAVLSSNGEWRDNWKVVLAAALCLAFPTIPYVAVGIFMLPLQQEFGWSRTAISISVPISGITIALLSPLVGRMIDRIGARRIGLAGGVIVCIFYGLLSQVTSSIAYYWTIWAFISVGIALSSPLVWTSGITSRFHAHRGAALAVMFCGSSFSQAVVGPAGVAAIESFGWRNAYAGIALLMAMATLPFAWFFFHDARDLARNQRRVSDVQSVRSISHLGASDEGLTVSAALGTPHFWLITGALLLGSSAVLAAIVHFVPMQIDRGFSPMLAASTAVGIPAAAVIGKLISGILIDRLPAPLVAGAIFLFASLAFVLLMHDVGAGSGGAILIAALLGVAGGAEVDVIAFLAARYFGLKKYGAIYGIFFAVYQLGISISPVVLSRVRDLWGSYEAAFPIFLAASLISAVMLFAMNFFANPGSIQRPPGSVVTA